MFVLGLWNVLLTCVFWEPLENITLPSSTWTERSLNVSRGVLQNWPQENQTLRTVKSRNAWKMLLLCIRLFFWLTVVCNYVYTCACCIIVHGMTNSLTIKTQSYWTVFFLSFPCLLIFRQPFALIGADGQIKAAFPDCVYMHRFPSIGTNSFSADSEWIVYTWPKLRVTYHHQLNNEKLLPDPDEMSPCLCFRSRYAY